MTNQSDEPTPRKPLRLWPGAAAAVLILLAMVAVPLVMPEFMIFGMLGGVVGGMVIVLWWVLFSRAPWSERIGAVVVMVVAVFATRPIVHPSIANAGMNRMMPIFSIPIMALGLVAWAAASRRLSTGLRRISMVGAILLACGLFTLVRTGGVTGDGISDLHWRWTPTPEDRLLAQAGDEPLVLARGEPKPLPPSTVAPAAPAAAETSKESPAAKPAAAPTPASISETEPAIPAVVPTKAEWPGFRGPNRDSIVRGVQIKTDWSASPPVQMWRRPIGPGWSSFAVRGDLLYTQEQRGDDEVVSCYKVSTGEPVWRHRDAVRFYESNGGAGPRGTPTLSDDRVYTMGATGILNALDASNGKVIWSRNAASDTGRKIPDWGIASSPLMVDDLVVVAVSGTLAAYDIATGKPRWVGPQHGGSYSSPQLATIDGVRQILLLSTPGAVSVAPADGALLWEYSWEGGAIVQPALTPDGGVLINAMSMMGGMGTRRLAVAHGDGGWTVEERWTSNGLKPYFNDFVIHKGHAFGFDGNILACIDLQDGKRKWKGGRFGNGQLVLLPDQDVLLVTSEDGELALVSATPDKFTELARLEVLKSKTWNHPALIGDTLLVRNGEEMAAFRLSLADR